MTGSPENGFRATFASTTGGVMTDEVGDVTGDLELLCRPGAGGLDVLVRYAEAEEWYTVSGSPVRVPGDAEDAVGRVVRHLSTPGPVIGGNEMAVTLEGFAGA